MDATRDPAHEDESIQRDRTMQYNFERDPAKARENLERHSITFERASQAFLDPLAISIYDDEHNGEQDRWVTLGKDQADAFLIVIHTFREPDPDNCN
jgi:uncharacterized DUF497 family protein